MGATDPEAGSEVDFANYMSWIGDHGDCETPIAVPREQARHRRSKTPHTPVKLEWPAAYCFEPVAAVRAAISIFIFTRDKSAPFCLGSFTTTANLPRLCFAPPPAHPAPFTLPRNMHLYQSPRHSFAPVCSCCLVSHIRREPGAETAEQ